MSGMTEEQRLLFKKFSVKRVQDVDASVLSQMSAPVIDGKERREIIDFFTSDEYMQDDKNGNLASFVVLSPEGLPLVFFAIRCGELFEETSERKMLIGHNAYVGLKILMDAQQNPQKYTSNDLDNAKKHISTALAEGLNLDDFEAYCDKKKAWKYDEIIDAGKETKKVLISYPAVELKLFGTNAAAGNYWKSLNLPEDKKIGETLFFMKVIEHLVRMRETIGCQYIYLFAADNEPEGELVQYYRVRLGFDADQRKAANKPYFDWKSQFLFQSFESLLNKKKDFISSFDE